MQQIVILLLYLKKFNNKAYTHFAIICNRKTINITNFTISMIKICISKMSIKSSGLRKKKFGKETYNTIYSIVLLQTYNTIYSNKL